MTQLGLVLSIVTQSSKVVTKCNGKKEIEKLTILALLRKEHSLHFSVIKLIQHKLYMSCYLFNRYTF